MWAKIKVGTKKGGGMDAYHMRRADGGRGGRWMDKPRRAST